MNVDELYEKLGQLIESGKGKYLVKFDNDKGVFEATAVNVYDEDNHIQIEV